VAVESKNILLTNTLHALGAEVDALQSIMFRAVDDTDHFDTTTLRLAVTIGDVIVINILLEAHANVNHGATTDRYVPPFVLPVASGRESTAKLLLKASPKAMVALDCTMVQTLL